VYDANISNFSQLIDAVHVTSTINSTSTTITTINYDFKRYYFQLNTLGATASALSLTVNNLSAPLNPLVVG